MFLKITLTVVVSIVSLANILHAVSLHASTDTNRITPPPLIASVEKNTQDNLIQKHDGEPILKSTEPPVLQVPFYSQFNDITPENWRKIGCGIASLAMLIEFYEPGAVTVDTLLNEGINAGAYLNNAGWTHAGLISLSRKYGLDGTSHDMAGLSMEAAFEALTSVLATGPVMVSVHYTFDPKNPIPHIVVINGVDDDKVYYNDPSEKSGGGSISISKFQSSWKKRYIEIRPTT